MYATTPELVLGFHDSVTLCCIAPVPLPVSASIIVAVAALLRKDNEAVAVPAACGRKVTVKGTDLPAATEAGGEIPLTTNSALVLVIEETVTGEPLAVSVPASATLDPVATLPKLSVLGARLN